LVVNAFVEGTVEAAMGASVGASGQAIAPTQLELGKRLSNNYDHVLFDLRNSRGGNGDVAAGYLTAMSLIHHYRISNPVTLLVDKEGAKRLGILMGVQQKLPAQVAIHTIDSIPKDLIVDFYLALASPSGTLKNHPHEDLTFSPDAVLLVQTVLGNTENQASINPYGLLQTGQWKFNMEPAGIGPNELGIYDDHVAHQLRGHSMEETRNFVLQQIATMPQDDARSQLDRILSGERLSGAKIGLVYGITALHTRQQFTSELRGLVADKTNSYCLITPSNYDLRYVDDPGIKDRVVVLDQSAQLPERAAPNMIYILKTPNLPHPLFVGLTYYSMKQGVTPIGAGDGFLSAGITLGEPFALTRVTWNARNILNLKNQLLNNVATTIQATEGLPSGNLDSETVDTTGTTATTAAAVLESVYEELDLSKAQELQGLRPIFHSLQDHIPSLTEKLVRTALGIRRLQQQRRDFLDASTELREMGLTLKEAPKAPEKLTSTRFVRSDSHTEEEDELQEMLIDLQESQQFPEAIKQKILSYYQTPLQQCQSTIGK
jgi:hypothetical protein